MSQFDNSTKFSAKTILLFDTPEISWEILVNFPAETETEWEHVSHVLLLLTHLLCVICCFVSTVVSGWCLIVYESLTQCPIIICKTLVSDVGLIPNRWYPVVEWSTGQPTGGGPVHSYTGHCYCSPWSYDLCSTLVSMFSYMIVVGGLYRYFL